MLTRFWSVWLCVTPWTRAHEAPLSKGFSRQECWSGLPCPLPEDLPDPGIEPPFLTSPALAGGLFHYQCLVFHWDHYWFQIWPMYMLMSTVGSYYVLGCLGRKGYKWRKEMGPDCKYVVILYLVAKRVLLNSGKQTAFFELLHSLFSRWPVGAIFVKPSERGKKFLESPHIFQCYKWWFFIYTFFKDDWTLKVTEMQCYLYIK